MGRISKKGKKGYMLGTTESREQTNREEIEREKETKRGDEKLILKLLFKC